MMRNATKGLEQTKVANEESASNMLGGTRMQRIIVSVIPNSQLVAPSIPVLMNRYTPSVSAATQCCSGGRCSPMAQLG